MQTDFPAPPDVGLFTRFVLENPWPLGVVLLAVAAAMVWAGLREGRRGPLLGAAVCALLAVAALATGHFVTTPAEHAEQVAVELVETAVAGEINKTMALFAPEADLTIGSPRNPGMSIRSFETRLNQLHASYTISNNRIRTLRGFAEDPETATVHLACSTEVEGWSGATPTQWVLRIERQDDTWLITRITFLSIRGMTPDMNWW